MTDTLIRVNERGDVRDVDGDEQFEHEQIRTLAVVPQEPRGLAIPQTPEDMIGLASRMATALKDVVERQKLYALISGKKFPQVEAWMTIGRMDNVVAREAQPPIRHDDGSYEAFVELIRLSDGLAIGSGSALCGTPDDKPWAARSEPARRSMAVTRATSRAFRQQYSWIMALAGYEPTPAEEMPRDGEARTEASPRSEPSLHNPDGSLIGTVEIGKGDADFELRQTPDGYITAFRLVSGRKGIKVVAHDPLASALHLIRDQVLGQRATCWGRIKDETFWTKDSTPRQITYQVLTLDRIATADLLLPAAEDEQGDELDAIAAALP